ncbi:MAG TPA: glutaminase, partial [Conexibacter sp.]|nr:glutaminase [Conexibacter sp.]
MLLSHGESIARLHGFFDMNGQISTLSEGFAGGSVTVALVRSPIDDYLHGLLERCRAQDGGAVADYIPELARVDPELTGICLATIDGHVYEAG